MSSLFDLSGRVALVTGSSRGLGLAASDALAKAGATLILTDVLEEDLKRQSARFSEHGWRHSASLMDVTDEPAIARIVEGAMSDFGRIDILVNNAGIMIRKPALETSRDDFRRILEVNVISALNLSSAVAPHMTKAGYGRIVNLSSIMGHIGRAGQVTYVASKHAIVGLTKSLAAEWGPHGITVNAIAPGYVYTEMNRAIIDDQVFHNSVILRTPLRRWAEPDEIGGTIIYLSSEASSFVTGQTILLDGGMTVTVPDPGSTAIR